MENNNPIDRQTLIKYLKGELSPEEAWKVEKAMQEDPFLAEAMEGIEIAMKQGDVKDDFEELERRINIRDTKRRTQGFPLFIRAAAVFLILAVSIFTVIEVMHRNSGQQSEIAMQKTKATTDSAGTYNDTGEKQPERKEEAISSPSQSEVLEKTNAASRSSERSGQARAVKKTEPESEESNPAMANTREPMAQAAGAPSESNGAGLKADTGSSVKIVPQVPAEKTEYAVSSEAAGRMDKKARAVEPDQMSLAKSNAPVSDLSLSANSVKSHPVTGDSLYNQYLHNHLKYPAAARHNGTEGDVIVQFTVEPDSTIRDIKIIKGIGNGCDEEAIRLIRQGPKWAPMLNYGKPVRSTAIYKVPFSLQNTGR